MAKTKKTEMQKQLNEVENVFSAFDTVTELKNKKEADIKEAVKKREAFVDKLIENHGEELSYFGFPKESEKLKDYLTKDDYGKIFLKRLMQGRPCPPLFVPLENLKKKMISEISSKQTVMSKIEVPKSPKDISANQLKYMKSTYYELDSATNALSVSLLLKTFKDESSCLVFAPTMNYGTVSNFISANLYYYGEKLSPDILREVWDKGTAVGEINIKSASKEAERKQVVFRLESETNKLIAVTVDRIRKSLEERINAGKLYVNYNKVTNLTPKEIDTLSKGGIIEMEIGGKKEQVQYSFEVANPTTELIVPMAEKLRVESEKTNGQEKAVTETMEKEAERAVSVDNGVTMN